MKPRILHIIDSLRKGGAEVLLIGVLDTMKEYDHSIVTLWPENEFDLIEGVNYHNLKYHSKLHLPHVVQKLKKIIRNENPALIHSHLLSATMIARLAKPKSIPLLFSVHNILSKSAFQYSKLSWLIEKLTYRKDHFAIFVSHRVSADYQKTIGIKGAAKVLYNYISDDFFKQEYQPIESDCNTISLVTVASLKDQKNHRFLIHCLSMISQSFTLDIYGEGPLKEQVAMDIRKWGLEHSVRLKGSVQDIPQILTQYDIFVLPSKYEGFGIAPVEAMAVGLPMLLSDIPVFKEVIMDNAVYFKLESQEDFCNKLLHLMSDFGKRKELSRKGRVYAKKIAEKQNYLNQLKDIYNQHIGNNKQNKDGSLVS